MVMLLCSVMGVLLFLFLLPGRARAASEPRVAILGTGGTIAGTGRSPTQLTEYAAGSLTARQIVDAVPGINTIADITTEQIVNVNSNDVSLDDCQLLSRKINALLATDVHGVVVTHGTSTLEETAYFLNLTVNNAKPVVLVGAMRPSSAISADGPLNLLQAVAVAAHPAAEGQGVLIVCNGEINSARDTTKSNTTQVQTFVAPDFGLLGYVVQNRPVFYRRNLRMHTLHSDFAPLLQMDMPRVLLLSACLDADRKLLQLAIDSRPDGIVLAAGGNGALSTDYRNQLAAAARDGIAVVRASHTGSGVVTRENRDMDLGFVAADTLNPQKARILLMLALTKTRDRDRIQAYFDTY